MAKNTNDFDEQETLFQKMEQSVMSEEKVVRRPKHVGKTAARNRDQRAYGQAVEVSLTTVSTNMPQMKKKASNKNTSEQMSFGQDGAIEMPPIMENIRLSEVIAANHDQPFYPAIVKRSIVVSSDEMEDILLHNAKTSMTRENLKELKLIDEDEGEVAAETSKSTKMVTMSEEVLSPLIQNAGLTTYDRAVLEAIYSQLMASENESNAIFTIRGIFRTMCGTQNSKISVSRAQQERIMESVLRLMQTLVSVEVKGKLGDGTDASLKRWVTLVPAVLDSINIGGNITTSVRVTSFPEFLSYANSNKGLAATPLDLLNIPGVSVTERNMAIINYLQHQITPFTYGYDSDERRATLKDASILPIDYQGIYEAADVKPKRTAAADTAKKPSYTGIYMKRVRETVRIILDCWKEKGYIKDYYDKEVAHQRSIPAVILVLPDTMPPTE